MAEPPPRPYVLIADDHPLFRDAIGRMLESVLPDHRLVGVSTFAETAAAAEANPPSLILLDLNMPGMEGFSGLIELRDRVPAVPVVIVSGEEAPETIRQAMTLGAMGFIPKSLDRARMAEAIRLVMDGEVFVPVDLRDPLAAPHTALNEAEFRDGYAALTVQQRKVLAMLAGGKANKVIAFELGISESTVKAHVSAILAKLKVTSRTQAALNARKLLRALG